VVDTNIWIALGPFTPTFLPDLWAAMETMAKDERIVVPEEVVRETKVSHHATLWMHNRTNLHRPTIPVWDDARVIADRYPSLIKIGQPSSWADPFLIATAIVEKRNYLSTVWEPVPPEYVVVTAEVRKFGRIAIRDACDAEGLPSANFEEWMEIEGVRFVRA
jgi:hypothetical protein